MSGPISTTWFTSNLKNINGHLSGGISPMNISFVNSTKNRDSTKVIGKRATMIRKSKIIEHKKAKLNYENFKKK